MFWMLGLVLTTTFARRSLNGAVMSEVYYMDHHEKKKTKKGKVVPESDLESDINSDLSPREGSASKAVSEIK